MNNTQSFKAALYVRLSKEDGDSFSSDKNESNSISNQKLLLQSFIDKMPDIQVVDIFEDDGYTGTNFERPGFQKMLEAIKLQKINCVVVKDFSRLGREYLGVGNYIEKLFPSQGIRFISVNDNYDSLKVKSSSDSLIVPFKNLLNEQYSRDTSIKVRSALKTRRQQGLYVSSFAVFGYKKDPSDNNHLLIDEYAANVVTDIFKMKLGGLSMSAIAKKLSAMGIPSPADYKRHCGIHYCTPFKKTAYSKWSAKAVQRILENEIYCGHTVQGKRMRKSYKLNIDEFVPKEQWDRVENTHEAIIDERLFYEVQRLLAEDTRIELSTGHISPLAGKLYCADCGASMVRHSAYSCGKKYVYYVCGNHKRNKSWCSLHMIQADKLEQAVLTSIQAQLTLMLEIDKAMQKMDSLVWEQRENQKLEAQLAALEAQIAHTQKIREAVYEDLKEGLINKNEFDSLRRGFTARLEEAEAAKKKLEDEQKELLSGLNRQQAFLAEFRKFSTVTELNRAIVVALVEKITVADSSHVSVEFRYKSKISSLMEHLSKAALGETTSV